MRLVFRPAPAHAPTIPQQQLEGAVLLNDRAEMLRRLPKTDLHCHLDGSLRPATLLELGRQGNVPLPAGDADGLRREMRIRDGADLAEYLRLFDLTLSVLQDEEALEPAAPLRLSIDQLTPAHLDAKGPIRIRGTLK